ncbi:MAG TPA: ATP-binding protein [Candidatus Angelobacter sp.]|nr:ATP-binding protein [Candidatus Angelobacter sp.]
MNVRSALKTTPADLGRWWKSLFEASTDAQLVCRDNGLVEQINSRAVRLFNLNPLRDEGSLSVLNLLAAPADKKLSQIWERGLTRASHLHSVGLASNTSPYSLVDLELVPLGDGFTLLTFKEVSHRLRLESHVQRLVTAIDATPDVFYITDEALRITFVNPSFQVNTGYSIEEVLGRTDEFLRSDSEAEKIKAYRASVAGGREWSGELVSRRRDGSTYFADLTISPICDIASRFIGYVACERDVSIRKQLQNELRIKSDFIQSILKSLDGAIYSLDRDFCLTHANDGWRTMPAEHGGVRMNVMPVIGRPIFDYVPDAARRDELRGVFLEVLATGIPQDNRFHAADGRHWLLKISPWRDGDYVRGLICNIADQTYYHELQDQLFQAQKMEIIGTLAAGVAHDFNNLLHAIRGNSGLILRHPSLDPKVRHEIEQIDLAAMRATEISQQLLSFSRESEGRRHVVDLNEVIHEASQMARRTLRGNVVIELQPASEPLLVRMDPTRASQVLLNLCVNAQDAMPQGGRLTISNSIVTPPDDLAARHGCAPGVRFARCSVTDTGTGIPPEILARIFQPFFTTKAKGKGTGLGLPIVQRVAQESGGFVGVDSIVGKGTTFHLYLPVAQEEITPVNKPAQAELARGEGRVLVVDDVDLLREFTKAFLETTGLTVLLAGSGAEAVQVLESAAEPVDLVFTDYNMPGMNGVELIEKIAARWPKMKFVLASGYLDDATRQRILRTGASILSKPYDLNDAAELVMQKLNAGSAA